jgi:hypothetical protein
MTALAHLYTSGVLWLLSLVAKDAIAAIYRRGQIDGMTELRDFMRGDLTVHHVAREAERMRSYNDGFRDAMRYFDADETPDDAPSERVM